MKTSITIEIDTDNLRLRSVTDLYLAEIWHIAQANPAPDGDIDAGRLADEIGYEIIRRWLKRQEPEIYSHTGKAHYWRSLIDLGARFIDGRWQIPTGDGEQQP